jgi:hypothetical protein
MRMRLHVRSVSQPAMLMGLHEHVLSGEATGWGINTF